MRIHGPYARGWVSFKNEIKTWMIIISYESIEIGAKIDGETHIEWIWTSSDSIKINGKPQQTLSNAHIGSHIYSDNAMKRSERNQKKDTWTSALQGAFLPVPRSVPLFLSSLWPLCPLFGSPLSSPFPPFLLCCFPSLFSHQLHSLRSPPGTSNPSSALASSPS